jgi:cyclopropane fatty-acyl-phospholipid synthase-like methyltransferase
MKKIVANFTRSLRNLLSPHGREVRRLYREKGYLEAYTEQTDERVAKNPQEAIGGSWEEVGLLQFEFLRRQGLMPHHRMLDIGCGTLRGGRHAIRYLDPGCYSGIDLSSKAIEYGQELVQEEGLSDKRPNLVVSRNKDLKFGEFSGQMFDYILAQSVFTHLMEEHIEECLQHVGNVMHDDGQFFFTFREASTPTRVTLKEFAYPFSFLESLAAKHGLVLANLSHEYPHPKGQKMARATKGAKDGRATT